MRYVALLAGINVGKRRVKMEQLCSLLEEIGFTNVQSVIASGNLLFDSDEADKQRLEAILEQRLHKGLGYRVDTFVRTPKEIATVLRKQPFAAVEADNPKHSVYVIFLRNKLPKSIQPKLHRFSTEMDEFHLAGSELYWLCRGKITETLVSWPEMGKIIAPPSTMRNLNTVKKLGQVRES